MNNLEHAGLRQELVDTAAYLADRGLAPGSTGNISVRIPGGCLVSPTNSRLGQLDPVALSQLDVAGHLVAGPPPSKEAGIHAAIYRSRADSGAIVHLHSTAAVAWSLRRELPRHDALPPLTAYSLMKAGPVGLIDFFPPGADGLAEAIAQASYHHRALLLANHGLIASDSELAAAAGLAEEIEETARLALLLQQQAIAFVPLAERSGLRRDAAAPTQTELRDTGEAWGDGW